MNYDVFNGDADGIISLIQLRLDEPREAKLITGVKRDINLLKQVVPQASDNITVLDISMEKNHASLLSTLSTDANVFYADHHRAGDIPDFDNLEAHIDLDANTCTALIIDNLLEGKYYDWAITAAYGDNLIAKADELADKAGFSAKQKEQLKALGTLINYNGYGAELKDLHIHPAELYQSLLKYESPFDVFVDKSSPYYKLQSAYEFDMKNALKIKAQYQSKTLGLYEMPNEAWSRRISGVYGNLLANQAPDSAHAVLTVNDNRTFMVSLRAPLNDKRGAGAICSSFDSGGGREAAAGINSLPSADMKAFIERVEEEYK